MPDRNAPPRRHVFIMYGRGRTMCPTGAGTTLASPHGRFVARELARAFARPCGPILNPSLGIPDMNMNGTALILLAVTLALFSRIWVPWGERASGNLVGRETLSMLGRLRMHGPSVGLVFVASVVLLALGKISLLTLLMVTALL